jgi:hypothetical protein
LYLGHENLLSFCLLHPSRLWMTDLLLFSSIDSCLLSLEKPSLGPYPKEKLHLKPILLHQIILCIIFRLYKSLVGSFLSGICSMRVV